MPRRSPMLLSIEIVLDETGRWCPTCALPSGVRRTYTADAGGQLTIGAAAVCLQCGSVLDATA